VSKEKKGVTQLVSFPAHLLGISLISMVLQASCALASTSCVYLFESSCWDMSCRQDWLDLVLGCIVGAALVKATVAFLDGVLFGLRYEGFRNVSRGSI